MSLELDDIQHFLLTFPRARSGRYEFLTFGDQASARSWLAGIIDRVGRAATVAAQIDTDSQWFTVAFTWNGLRALGVEESALVGFPEEFRQGMAARAEVLGDTGVNHPDQWVGDLASPELHAITVLLARDAAERDRAGQENADFVSGWPGVRVLSTLDLDAVPPYDYVHSHFGYRDRISQPEIEGTGAVPTPGSGGLLKPGEFFLGYPDESGAAVDVPQPEVLFRNGSYLAYRRLQEHVGAFRAFLQQNSTTPDEEELLAAKLMGRWRSGAPLVLAPEQDDPQLAADPQRNNDFDYATMDPRGYAVPLGAHIRRMNPRDTTTNMNQHRMIRRGFPYGPPLAQGAPEDGQERGLAAFLGCASLIRQFEFAQNVWINDPNFHDLRNERDPIIGTQDGTFEYKIPKRPVRRKIVGLPAFTTVRGGAYFFLPGIRALTWLAGVRK